MLPQPIRVQAVGHEHSLAVVRDGNVLQPASLRSQRHFGDAGCSVRSCGVHVQVALNIRDLDQRWDSTVLERRMRTMRPAA